MLDLVWYGASVAMVLYWALWLAGCRLPGTSRRPFRGWRYTEYRRRGPFDS